MTWITLITLLFAVLLAALAVGFVILPLVRPGRRVLVDEEGPLADLILRKDTVLQSIKELEFDYQTEKLSEEDYQRLDGRLRQQAIALLRQIEQAMPAAAGMEAQLEEAIRQRRQVTARPAVATPADPADEVMACPRCHSSVRATDNFCPKCGFALVQAAAQ